MSQDDAPSVTNQDPFQWPTRLVSAMAAGTSILDDLIGNPKMTNTDSAPNVTWSLLLDPSDLDSASVKCNDCKEVTEHIVTRVAPMPEPMIPETIKIGATKVRRLQMCTACGTMSLRQ